MADLFFNIADQVEFFEEFLSPGIVDEWATFSKILAMAEKDWDHIDTEGKFATQRLGLGGAQSFGARSDAKYPDAQQSRITKTKVYMKRSMMFSLGFDGMALEAARGKGAAVDPVDFEKDEQYKEIADDLSRQLIGDGSARMAQCKGSGSGATALYIDHPRYKNPSIFFKPGRVIDVYQADHTTGEVDSAKISAVDYDNNKLTIPSSSWSDDSWVFSEDAITATEGAGLGEMMGILGISLKTDPPIPNAANGLQGLTVASTPEWKAHVFDNNGIPRDLIEDLFIQVLQRVERYSQVKVILVSPGVYRAWFSILSAYKGIVNDKELWGGFSGLPFIYNGRRIPVVMDEFIPDGCAIFMNEKNLVLHVLTPGMIMWEKGTAGGILQKVADYNRYKAEGHFFGNLGTSLRPGFGILKDIREPNN